jgi:hypothetical protein
VTIEYPLELTPYQEEEPSSEALDIIKLKDNSNFILSMGCNLKNTKLTNFS